MRCKDYKNINFYNHAKYKLKNNNYLKRENEHQKINQNKLNKQSSPAKKRKVIMTIKVKIRSIVITKK